MSERRLLGLVIGVCSVAVICMIVAVDVGWVR